MSQSLLKAWVGIMRKEGREEGREEGLRQSVIRILRKRFSEIPPEMAEAIENIHSVEKLEELFDKALDCGNVAEFRGHLV